MSEQITSRIRRDELLGLLHATGAAEAEHHERITARMPAVTLEGLLIPDELPPPPFVIRFRSPAGTDEHARIDVADGVVEDDGTITDDIEPELSVAISRVTSNALGATIDAAIDAAVQASMQLPVADAVDAALSTAPLDGPPERRRNTALIARPPRVDRLRVLPMLAGFTLTFFAGVLLMMLLG